MNQLGLDGCISFVETFGGTERVIADSKSSSLENSSSDEECEINLEDVPWTGKGKCVNNHSRFQGFESSLSDNVAMLSKVVTSTVVKICLQDFKPLHLLFPKKEANCTVKVQSTLNNETYMAHLSSSFKDCRQMITISSGISLENGTDEDIAVYVKSDDTHWQHLQASSDIESSNPFEEQTKLTVIPSKTNYNLPLILANNHQLFFRPSSLKYSIGNKCYSSQKCNFDDIPVVCSSLNKSIQDFVLTIRTVDDTATSKRKIHILPYYTITNHLPVPIKLTYIVNLQKQELIDFNETKQIFYALADRAEEINVEVESGESIYKGSLLLSQGNCLDDAGVLKLSCDNNIDNIATIGFQISQTNLQFSANYHIHNQTGQDLFLMDHPTNKTYFIGSGRSTFLHHNHPSGKQASIKLRFSSSSWSELLPISDSSSAFYPICKTTTNKEHIFVRVEKNLAMKEVFISSLWSIKNNTQHSVLIEEASAASGNSVGGWTAVDRFSSAPLWPTGEPPSFRIKFVGNEGTSETFTLSDKIKQATLRMNLSTGVRVQLVETDGRQNVLQIEECSEATVPITIENWCHELVIRLQQNHQKQVWLINPGTCLNYTWDEPKDETPRATWNVYCGAGHGFPLEICPGKTLWGEEKVIYRCVRKYRGQAAISSDSGSETEEEFSDGFDDAASATSGRSQQKKSDRSSSVSHRNIVCKSRRVVYWISQTNPITNHAHIYFSTSRKSAARLLSAVHPKPKSTFLLAFNHLDISLMVDGVEKGRISCGASPHRWELLVNGTWQGLSAELNSLLEAAFRNNLKTLAVGTHFKFDLSSQTITSPLYAPLRRCGQPAAVLQLSRTRNGTFVGLAATSIQIETMKGHTGENLVRVEKPSLSINLSQDSHVGGRDKREIKVRLKEIELGPSILQLVGQKLDKFSQYSQRWKNLKLTKASVQKLWISQFGFRLPKQVSMLHLHPGTEKKPTCFTVRSQEFSIEDESLVNIFHLIEKKLVFKDEDLSEPSPDFYMDDQEAILEHAFSAIFVETEESGIMSSQRASIKHTENNNKILENLFGRATNSFCARSPFTKPNQDAIAKFSCDDGQVFQKLVNQQKWPEALVDTAFSLRIQWEMEAGNCQDSSSYSSRPLQRCPAGFLGLKPMSSYRATGWATTTRLCGDKGTYIHHEVIEDDKQEHEEKVILITKMMVVCFLQHTKSDKIKKLWEIEVAKIRNLPHLEGESLIIHLDETDGCAGYFQPMTISSANVAALNNVKLATEYALLLNMIYKPISNVTFNS